MKLVYPALFCFLLASSTMARADAIVTGTATVTYPNGGPTFTDSGSGSSLSLHAGSGQAFSNIVANVGPTSGSVIAAMGSDFVPPAFFTTASGDYSVSVNGEYMLTGGTGSGLANWSVNGSTVGLGPAQWTSCSITVAGVTQACSIGTGFADTGSFLVPFNTPLQLSFNTTYHGFVNISDGHQSTLTYSFGLSPVPEPGTALLLTTGVAWLAAIRNKLLSARK